MTGTLLLAFAALTYLLLGLFSWRNMVLPGPAVSSDVLFTGTTENSLHHWRCDASAVEARGDFALLLPKATFLLLWPVAIVTAIAALLAAMLAVRLRK